MGVTADFQHDKSNRAGVPIADLYMKRMIVEAGKMLSKMCFII